MERDAHVGQVLRLGFTPGVVGLLDRDLGFFHLGILGQRRGLGRRQVFFNRRQRGYVDRAKLSVDVAAQQVVQSFLCRGKLVLVLQELVLLIRELGLHLEDSRTSARLARRHTGS